jgi:hypothetical protein
VPSFILENCSSFAQFRDVWYGTHEIRSRIARRAGTCRPLLR